MGKNEQAYTIRLGKMWGTSGFDLETMKDQPATMGKYLGNQQEGYVFCILGISLAMFGVWKTWISPKNLGMQQIFYNVKTGKNM